MTALQDRTPGDPALALYDLLGNAREWTLDRWNGDVPAGERFYAVRGLPLVAARAAAPADGLAARSGLCSHGDCLTKYLAERRDVGFRCARATR